jgi:bifunctional non-homologous end joining protein LigD
MPTDAVAPTPTRYATALPRVELISLVPRPEPFDDPAWIFEPSYDGVSAILYHSDDGCEIEVFQETAVRLHDLRDRVAEVLGTREAVLAGQIVALDRQGKPQLGHLLRGEGYLAFSAQDLLWIDGRDLRDRPLRHRKQCLAQLLPEDSGPLYKVLTIEEHGRALFGASRRLELGGIVAKCQDDPYGPGTVWYAISNPARLAGSVPEVLRDQRQHQLRRQR